MRRPGFTILELVIALGLVVLLGAVVTPTLYERLGDSRLDAAGRDVAAVVAAVRADALREGRALELRAERAGDAVRLVSTPLEEETAAAGVATELPATTSRGLLPDGVDATLSPPSAGVAERPPGPPEEEAGAHPIVLGVLLPDGSAWSSSPVYLALARAPHRALEVKLNSWTGVATVTDVPLAQPDAEIVEAPP
jgi:type II secretory pathway pseudopilin PulG